MSFGTKPGDDEVLYLPLGGTGEIGMNLNLYGHKGKWLMVDLGISFADHRLPGVDVIMPDPDFIEQQSENLVGLVLTHAHEDHIGAVPHLWPFLRCPIYATPFTRTMVYHKLVEHGLENDVEINVIPVGGRFEVGPFDIELLSMTHSIPEPASLAIRTAVGTVFHSGDWKFDPDPLVGADYDESGLKALGEEGVLAMISDSTNVMSEREAGSEATVREGLTDVIAGCTGRVAVTCFASNVARVESVIRAAEACDRRVLLMGRSMHRIYQAARDNGYLENMPPLASEEEFEYLSPDQVVILCTGSQGEPRSATARLSRNEFRSVWLDEGDTVVFSSRVIPGNETAVYSLQNNFSKIGVEVITDREAPVHVSGHPSRDEVMALYDMIKPAIAVPTHGEARHLREHAKVAALSGTSQQIIAGNGDLIRFTKTGKAEKIDSITAGTLAVESGRLVETGSAILKDRQKMSFNGAATVTVVLDEAGDLLDTPMLSLRGLIEIDEEFDIFEEAVDAVKDALKRLRKGERQKDSLIEETARIAVRRYFNKVFNKKPVTDVHVVRIAEEG
ncbi:ribonuclease J [Kiloniella sp. b19]|uniref:ribonuclease J n=1 Tax=Kiloniella sp. GXU_MW_B19 TaxID=3141326 RepID=UPI0031D29047